MDNLTFNFNRFFLLIKKEIFQGKRKPFIIGGAIFLLLGALTISIGKDAGSDPEFIDFHYLWFPILLFFGGFLFTSFSFSELSEKTKAHQYLTLPASNLEKFMSKWLISSFGFALVFSIGYYLFSLLIGPICNATIGFQPKAFSVFSGHHEYDNNSLFFLIKIYLVIQTIFLVGATMFRKYAFFKTPLAVLAIVLAFAFLLVFVARILLWDWFEGWFEPVHINMQPNSGTEDFFENTFLNIVRYLFFLVLPLWMLTIGFFKLKEKEA